MRSLHPVAAHERFLASGTYKRQTRGTETRYTEAWTLHDVNGARLVRIDQDARFTEKWSRLAEVLLDPAGRVERVNIRAMHDDPQAEHKVLRLEYSFFDEYIQMMRQIDGGERDYTEAANAPGLVVRLLDFALFWGRALAISAAGATSALPVFVPFLNPRSGPGQVLPGMLPDVKQVTDDPITLGQRTIPARRYDTGARRIWVDAHNVPLRIWHARQQIDDVLTHYAPLSADAPPL